MAKLTVKAGASIDDGVYEGILLHVEVCDPTEKSPNKKPWLKYTFTVYDGSPEGQELTAASSTALGPKSKARPWIEALLGRRLEPGEEIDTDTLSLKPCQLVIKNDPETEFAKVCDVLSPRNARQPKPAQPLPAATPDGVPV